MTIFHQDDRVTLHHGDCLDVLRGLPDASVDSVVTDPPYGLEFMGKEWDKPSGRGGASINRPEDVERWNNAYSKARVTYHSGPQAMREFGAWCEEWTAECLRVLKPGGHLLAFGGTRTWHRLACAVEDAGFEVRDSIAWLYGSGFPKSLNLVDEDGQRTGQGTALKPAFEPVVVARKPLTGTVAANVLAHGTGALNIDACRVAMSPGDGWDVPQPDTERINPARPGAANGSVTTGRRDDGARATPHTQGRWPANVVLDESQAAALDEQAGTLIGGANPTRRGADTDRQAYGEFRGQDDANPQRGTDSGGASRFLYVAKAGADERPRVNGTAHPTVKPLTLMRWLVRLVTPPGGTVLEPFAGSGTTVEAALLEGFQCIAIEKTDEYLPLVLARIHRRRNPVEAIKLAGDDLGLFGFEEGA